MLNLFIGIIVSAMQSFAETETRGALDAARDHIEADFHKEVRAIRADIAEMRALLDERSPRN